MTMINKVFFLFCLLLVLSSCKNANSLEEEQNTEFAYRIPAGENSWVSGNLQEREGIIKEAGVSDWKDPRLSINSYFHTQNSGEVVLGLRVRSASPTILKVCLGEESREIEVESAEYTDVPVGSFELSDAGYQQVTFSLLGKPEASVDIEEILLGGTATAGEVNFVEGNAYFGRRGPSVHLKYDFPKDEEIIYFYNEIEVPEGEDVIGSFFMANGFADGYFGIQVNSEDERRILFSVWSPYDTQDPDEIPEDYRIKLLKKGEGVHAGTFGNEGSGGQSYKVYDWKSDTTYRFLLKGEPVENNYTNYTAYFLSPETGTWELIASFSRPYTQNYLGNLHSFLENFVPATGDSSRYGLYKNQWVLDKAGNWTEITKAIFTADATARQNHRLDYAGGTEGNAFFLKNCGFFDQTAEINLEIERTGGANPPDIALTSLP